MTNRIAPPRTHTPPVLLSRDVVAGVTVSVYESGPTLYAITDYNGQREEWLLTSADRAEVRNCAACARGLAKHGRGDKAGIAVYSSVAG
jgi:hypothetical protein